MLQGTNPSPVDFGTAHSTQMKATGDSVSKLRVHNFAISLDGYGAGPRQSRENPLGVGGEELHGWYVGTRAFREINGKTGGTTGPDNDFAKRFGEGIGAYIMGRNMFCPVRGPWPDDRWRGWWGENPPYHVPVFVLTNHAREPIAPILLGSGEALFAGMDLPALGYACTEHVATPAATHVVLARKA